jgi:hypothetical protein
LDGEEIPPALYARLWHGAKVGPDRVAYIVGKVDRRIAVN